MSKTKDSRGIIYIAITIKHEWMSENVCMNIYATSIKPSTQVLACSQRLYAHSACTQLISYTSKHSSSRMPITREKNTHTHSLSLSPHTHTHLAGFQRNPSYVTTSRYIHEVFAGRSWVSDKIWLSELGWSTARHQRKVCLFWICLSLT